MKEYQRESQFILLLEYFRRNPALMLSVSYISLTLCGIFYSKAFYKEFDIDILQFAEISDLLIIGISEPRALLMFAGGLLMAYGTDRLYQFSYDIKMKWHPKPKSFKRTLILYANYIPKHELTLLSGLVALFVVYGWIFVSLFAQWRADDIRQGNGEYYQIFGELHKTEQTMVFLGTTTNYILLFDDKIKKTVITPVENVTKLMPIDKPANG